VRALFVDRPKEADQMWKQLHRFEVRLRRISAAAHAVIAMVAVLATQHVIPLDSHTLAWLIAWANVCTAVHRLSDPEQRLEP
jgi:hypothetical protein